jgi:hypothetical protein
MPAPRDVEAAPASATEIVPGTGGLTRRQLRELRAAQNIETARPVPLQAPTPQSPQSSDRTVADVLGTIAGIEDRTAGGRPQSPQTLDAAAIEQATEADGSPDAIEPLAEAVAHSEEPRRHRSTWAPAPNAPGAADHDPAQMADAVADTVVPHASDGAAPSAQSDQDGVPGPPLRAPLPNPKAPGVFPLDLDAPHTGDDTAGDDTVSGDASTSGADADEVPDATQPAARADTGVAVADAATGRRTAPAAGLDADAADRQRASSADADAGRPVEPKPVTTAFTAPAGHWSRQAEVDDHLHDPATGAIRETQPATNALIMPNSALSDVTGALNATGEVIITGSIDLPKALASTGSHTPIDGAEVDRLLEQHDAEAPSTDASPVRASRAVSSHTSTRAVVLAAAKPKQSRMPTILAFGAAGLGVIGVAAVVIAGFALKLF